MILINEGTMSYIIRDEIVLNVLDNVQKNLIIKYKRNVTKKETLKHIAENYLNSSLK